MSSSYTNWTEPYYEFEAILKAHCRHRKDFQIIDDLFTLVHSAEGGFDHSAEIWPRVRDALDEAFESNAKRDGVLENLSLLKESAVDGFDASNEDWQTISGALERMVGRLR